MVHTVEELLKVQVHYPVSPASYVLLCRFKRLVCALSWPEAVGRWGEGRVVQRVQRLKDGLLDETVHHRGNAKQAHSPIRLGYLYPLDRLWLVRPTKQLLP